MRAATSKKTNFRERQGRPALLHIIPRLPPEQARNVLKLSARRMDSLRSSPSPGAWSATSIRRQKKTMPEKRRCLLSSRTLWGARKGSLTNKEAHSFLSSQEAREQRKEGAQGRGARDARRVERE